MSARSGVPWKGGRAVPALALLWAALVFSRGRPIWRPWYVVLALFPPVWSYLAIYRMESFLLAAWPAVAFLSAATAWTAWAVRWIRLVRQAYLIPSP